jgi:hypothetical protein
LQFGPGMTRAHSKLVTSPEAAALALLRSYTTMAEALRNSMGEAGRTALLSRALACTEKAHPALKDLRILSHDAVRIDDIVASVDVHGRDKVAAAIDALIGAVRDMLTQLIGADMAVQLIGEGGSHQPPRGAQEP